MRTLTRVILGAFMFFASRRQRKAMQATIDLHDSLKVGDRVNTISGLQATIAAITDQTVELEIAPGVITTWSKMAVRERIEPEHPEHEDAGAPGEITESTGIIDTPNPDRP